MEKCKSFTSEKIEVCRNCQGKGYVEETSRILSRTKKMKCPICGGTGLIKKVIQGQVEVSPYDPDRA